MEVGCAGAARHARPPAGLAARHAAAAQQAQQAQQAWAKRTVHAELGLAAGNLGEAGQPAERVQVTELHNLNGHRVCRRGGEGSGGGRVSNGSRR